jgi:serine-type D-Ala-D-Ala carboxypeptidase/endopeptidase (penicillin-binding protein 4)
MESNRPDCAAPLWSRPARLPSRRTCLRWGAAALAAPAGALAGTRSRAAGGGAALVQGCGLPSSSIGLYARALDEVSPLVSLNAETPFVMASTTKLVTSMAALDLLGPQFRWRTFAFARGPIENGRLEGDLWIVGGGNALLTSAELRNWMGQWRDLGLNEIAGNIVLDRFAFQLNESDHERTPPPAADRPHHNRPDAFSLDEGVLRISLQPDAAGRVAVQMEPPLAGLEVDQRQVRRGGCSAWVQWGGKGVELPSRVKVVGEWNPHCGRRQLAALAPLGQAEFMHRAVAGVWAEAGGHLGGSVVDQTQPLRPSLFPADLDGLPQMPFAVHLSERLPLLLRGINKSSDNFAARNLMLALSRGFPGRAATLPAAQARMREWLASQGLGPGDVEVENGSGLSRGERAKPRAMVHLLANAWQARQANSLVDSLPVAGVDGTLEHRLRGGAAEGQAYLKTGTLLDARALAGYVRSRSGRIYAVAALVNHPEASRAVPSLDGFIEWLARAG